MPITGGQAVIELSGKNKQLPFGEAEAFADSLQHDIHNQLHGVGKGCVSQFHPPSSETARR